MSTIILSDLLTGLLAKAPDFIFTAVILAALFVMVRDIILNDRRHSRTLRDLGLHQDTQDSEIADVKTLLRGLIRDFHVFTAKIHDDHEEFRANFRRHDERFQEIDDRFQGVDDRFQGIDNRFHDIRMELQEIRHTIKEIDLRPQFKEMQSDMKEMKSDIVEIKGTLEATRKDIHYQFKESDFKHNALETRVSKLESPEDKNLKSKQA